MQAVANRSVIGARYRCGYHEYGRVRLLWYGRRQAGSCDTPDYFTNGASLVSPAGEEWRFFGRGEGCPRFFRDGTYRDLDYGTILRAMTLGWRWLTDKGRIERSYSITRWPDGTHFYVSGDKGETVTYRGKVKFDTWEQANDAGQRWNAKVSAVRISA